MAGVNIAVAGKATQPRYHRANIVERDGLSPEVVAELLDVDPSTGRLFWKRRGLHHFREPRWQKRWNTRYAGTEAFTAISNGYKTGCILGTFYAAHRVVFALHYGRWPVGEVDHIDGDRGNNRPSNLREVSRAENQRNRSSAKGSSSQYLGVCRCGAYWRADIRHDGRHISLGKRFRTEEEAARAYDRAARQFHRDYARLNSDNWRRLGEIIADKKAEFEAAISARDEAAAAEAHDDLVSVEHEQRVIETVRKYSK